MISDLLKPYKTAGNSGCKFSSGELTPMGPAEDIHRMKPIVHTRPLQSSVSMLCSAARVSPYIDAEGNSSAFSQSDNFVRTVHAMGSVDDATQRDTGDTIVVERYVRKIGLVVIIVTVDFLGNDKGGRWQKPWLIEREC